MTGGCMGAKRQSLIANIVGAVAEDISFFRRRGLCPCCGRTASISAEMRADRLTFQGGAQWACQDCLESGQAILADPDKQLFRDHKPYLAYYDVEHTCRDCEAAFVFTKTEQHYWYEERQHRVQSRPARCPTCRARRRKVARVMKDRPKRG